MLIQLDTNKSEDNLVLSKTKVDKAGKKLSEKLLDSDERFIEYDDIFNAYRKEHLKPLTEVTLKLQQWLIEFSGEYYIAQRLKRRAQILRKLSRFSVRLSQLQDIGGCRIIVENNLIVDELLVYIKEKLGRSRYFQIKRVTDYRIKGREKTGYRAVHIIIERSGFTLEIQIRSRIQHYWAESIERTSIIYGYSLKEGEGHAKVIKYYKVISDAFFEIEAERKPPRKIIKQIDSLRPIAEAIIKKTDLSNILNSRIEEKFIKAMISRDSKLRGKFHNWMLIFNWQTGRFVNWEVISRNPEEASKKYTTAEKDYPSEAGFEVVMIGSTDVSTIRHTHSHYFGIENYNKILADIDDSVLAFSKGNDIDQPSQNILKTLAGKDCWGIKKVNTATLRNHYCQDIDDIKEKVKELSKAGIVVTDKKGNISLNPKKKALIEGYL